MKAVWFNEAEWCLTTAVHSRKQLPVCKAINKPTQLQFWMDASQHLSAGTACVVDRLEADSLTVLRLAWYIIFLLVSLEGVEAY